ncbi:MAG: glycerol-3-phosphate 1-O-acyltransferase PlsY [Clostridiales bacterium]|jgi:glycerol-3-phosphate acyltransferase PlsY|nr:glycerol-3-phosphate 1-O-acyltransferase PlsY [Clostridiales bacterium]
MGKYILAIILGYLIGNFATSYVAGKLIANIDIRNHGSGNAGATNTFRVLGPAAGTIVFIGDVLKGLLAALIGRWLTGTVAGGMLAGTFAVVGHNWPVMFNFKGGKGIASSFGLIMALFPKIGLILFVVVVTVILVSRYVSLGSITAAVLFPILLIIFGQPFRIVLLGLILCLMALWRHTDNISRLRMGKENKISFLGK